MVRAYKGNRYQQEKLFKLSILILGESTYDRKWGDDLPPDRNKTIIDDYVRKNDPGRTLRRAVGVFYGRTPTPREQCAFWDVASFANFVQFDMGYPPERPSNLHWKSGQDAFRRYLNDCTPQLILVLGKGVWGNLPRDYKDEKFLLGPESGTRPYRIYTHQNGDAFVFGINHPTSRGWSYEKWHQWVMAALGSAQSFHHES